MTHRTRTTIGVIFILAVALCTTGCDDRREIKKHKTQIQQHKSYKTQKKPHKKEKLPKAENLQIRIEQETKKVEAKITSGLDEIDAFLAQE